MSTLEELLEERRKDPNWQKEYEEYKKVALDPEHIRQTNEYFDKIDREYGRRIKVFHKHYLSLKKIVSDKLIYCDDEYAHRLNFFIEDKNIDADTQYKLDKLLSEMYVEFDKQTLVPHYSLLVVPKNIIDDHKFKTGKEFFKGALYNVKIIELNTGGKIKC